MVQDVGRSNHPKSTAAVHPVFRLRPPDLIIQGELHLITGALGTTVGLFEVAIDALTTWRTGSGAPARPLLVASTPPRGTRPSRSGRCTGGT